MIEKSGKIQGEEGESDKIGELKPGKLRPSAEIQEDPIPDRTDESAKSVKKFNSHIQALKKPNKDTYNSSLSS